LRDEHAVERVVVMAGKRASHLRVAESDRHWLKAARSDRSDQPLGHLQLPERSLDRNLPHADGADVHVWFVSDAGSGFNGQLADTATARARQLPAAIPPI
jgi:hypothetical protein